MGLTADQIAEILAACERVKTASTFQSAYTAWEPLLSIKPDEVPPELFKRIATAFFTIIYTKKRRLQQEAEYQTPLMGSANIDDPNTFEQFKQAVTAYIKWVTKDQITPPDLEAVQQAVTFEEVRQVLADFDDPDLSFLNLVRAGYFV